jgi:hypothetical protein
METTDISESTLTNDDNQLINLEEYDDAYYENYFKLITQSSVYDGVNNDFKHSKMSPESKIYWAQMDELISEYVKNNPIDYYFAQKRGEEMMNIDYDNPREQCKRNELFEYGREVWKDIKFNGILYEDLTEHEIECLKVHLDTNDIQGKINEYLSSLNE